ncbi:S9 family peptidase [Thalassotalea agarivorans]|uniref:Dipeptidyl aminopeptidase/acylaminoacyl peptidase n=1 Tax=Thalassotalea agarivorans TaxID=349064 RepID=A0A1I0ALX8_THASX|nr:S9 family peptidase [Thalassotalea agarivorans]SES94870.1 Dipeptidyl aminopeptidase/acylaminoacyl peptidase [Thalassotalea agarivorans]
MYKKLFIWAAISLLLMTNIAIANSGKKALQYQDLFELEYVSSPIFANNGKTVIFERRSFDVMTDAPRINLWQVDIDGSNERPLVSGAYNAYMPKLSPQGDRLAYISTQEGAPQLYVRFLDTAQTVRVTNLQKSPSAISWSNDGKHIAFIMFTPEKPAVLFTDMPQKPKGAEWAGNATFIDATNYRSDGAGFLPAGFNQIYVVPANGGSAKQITAQQGSISGPLTWSAKNDSLYFGGNLNEDYEYQPLEADIYKVNVTSLDIAKITNNKGPDFAATISPNGKLMARLSFVDTKMSHQNAYIVVSDLNGKNEKVLAKQLDRGINKIVWNSNSKGLYFSHDDHGQKTVSYVSLSNKISPTNITLGGQSLGRPYTSGDFAVSRQNAIAYTLGTSAKPADLAVLTSGKQRTLTDFNSDLLADKYVAKVEKVVAKSSVDKREIEAWVAYPDVKKGEKVPLILEIHGGPHTAYGPNFSSEVQMMVAKGYAVVWANPRGSTSYGAEFANLIHHNYPSQDYDDLMDIVDQVVAKGNIDTDNLFVTGGSGGGVLTAWIVGKTDRFKAAVVAKPVINWLSFTLTADGYTYFSQYWMPGKPWEHVEHLWKHSPLSLVGNVKTPTMLLTGEVDYRTPMSETEQYYQALKLNRVDTAMVRIPKASHGIAAKPSNLIQKIGYIVAWFDKYKN